MTNESVCICGLLRCLVSSNASSELAASYSASLLIYTQMIRRGEGYNGCRTTTWGEQERYRDQRERNKKRSSSNQGDTKVHFLTSAKRLSAHLFPSLSFYHLFAGWRNALNHCTDAVDLWNHHAGPFHHGGGAASACWRLDNGCRQPCLCLCRTPGHIP